jgi:hypothetical protein
VIKHGSSSWRAFLPSPAKLDYLDYLHPVVAQ